ncbi:putative amastin-like surface protein [Leishmania major strain Friedlin]|uniref:Putative amastin-like surface protein n=1 Tax=Leishmania major TaxID=5664 RepID=Q4Q327_LEIMA|nr:putative amastin-like surface protein [Leishmania major strain Friedlin]XP_001686271.1 putative amastin-like surface protein [Leishmania major strain Friedlin]XP_001686287.1 putative amastin-like surface protein [Leishmania major strain Friedlin]CAG9582042.1 amastin-like_surface_protein_putative [Leishmania major strain Friedlin]CAG9582046.1 amastin-like_surface_protein_putative [Leishmania major strain Friedlin]CAJ07868.1 putative amastin-like surface protein [Leishmania major strain Fried|eukprot:XP_001686253.1 putative amastin-like surface protein [Leishmania major strain Friedlin]
MAYSIPLVVYVVVQFVALLLVLVGTPVDMFRMPSTGFDTSCITLWGERFTCTSSGYFSYIDETFHNCPQRLTHFRIAQAFAIISIFVYFAAFVMGLVLLYGCTIHRWVCLALNIVGAVTLFIVWAAMVVTYNKGESPRCPPLKEVSYYAAGFVLFLLAWILDILNMIILLLPCTVPATKANEKPESPTAQE